MRLVTVGLLFLGFLVAQEALGDISEKQKEQIQNGLKGAASLMKFFQEKNFFSALTKVSAVAGPIFSVAMVVLNIVFMFINVDSPEMQLMKTEFANLNNRLDKWSTEFGEIKRKIDWSALQIGYGDLERSIRTMRGDLDRIAKADEDNRQSQKSIFIMRYESSFLKSAEVLYGAMTNTEASFSDNIFRACQKYTEYHRAGVQNFMMGTFQLLVQAIEVQAAYITMKYNSTAATDFIRQLWDKKLQVLQERMSTIDAHTKRMWMEQMPVDAGNLLKRFHSQSNQQFTKTAMDYFGKKYDWRDWFIVSYNPISGWDNHAVQMCGGVILFRTNGRNFVMASVEREYRNVQAASKAQSVIDEYSNRKLITLKDGARKVMNDLSHMQKTCYPYRGIAAIQWGGGVWYAATGGYLGYKKICVDILFRGKSCYNTFLFG